MSYFLPYLAYTWAATGIAPEEDWTGTRPAGRESRTRLFTLVRYKTPDGYLQTTFGRVIIESFPDFCGGMMVYSPQIDTYRRPIASGGWGSTSQFYYPGDEPRKDMTFGWKALDDDPARAIDLAEVTGQSTWTTAEVEDYLMKCMARSVLTQAIALGKRGIVAADKYGGKMSWLWKEITAVSRGRVPIRHPAKYSVINDVTEPASPNAPMDRRVGAETRYITYICARMVEEVEVTVHAHDAVEWLNVNSGNTVSWLTLSIECAWDEDRDVEYDEYDDGDDGSVRTTRVDVPPEVYNLYSYRNFVRQVPRHFWRNG